MNRPARIVLSALLAFNIFSAAGFQASAQAGIVTVTAQILDYEAGYVFFTSGDGFKVAPNVSIVDLKSGAPAGSPQPRQYGRVTFDAAGIVTKIELTNAKLPLDGDYGAIRKFVIALSTPAPNPDLAPHLNGSRCASVRPGRSVTLNITVQVPPTTSLTDNVYMTTDQSGWNAQAYRLDRRDALHYRVQLKLLSGIQLHVLFDRGSMQSVQLARNGIEQEPYPICIGDEDAQTFTQTVFNWADQQAGASIPIPQTMPTPYNPAPFPNLPTPQPTHVP